MASIHKTKHNTYQVRSRVPGGGVETKTFKNKRMATRYKREIEAQIALGTYISQNRGAVDVADWVEQCFDMRSDLATSSVERTEGIIRNYIRPRWEGVKLSELEHSHVVAWIKQLSNGDLSALTVKKIGDTLKGALETAVLDKRIPSNPCKGVKYPKAKPSEQRYLTVEEVDRLAAATRDDREQLIVYTLAYTGLRWAELAGVRVKDYIPLRNRLSIVQTWAENASGLELRPTKDYEAREVPIPAFLKEKLSAYLAVSGAQGEDLIFTSPQGGVLRRRNEVRRWFTPAVERAGLGKLAPHELRHTAASLAVSTGATVLGVQRMLGHASASTTLDTYADLFDTDLDRIGEALHELKTNRNVPDLFRVSGSGEA